MGVFFYADGGRYEGGWMANHRSGEGLMSFANGEVRTLVGFRTKVRLKTVTNRRQYCSALNVVCGRDTLCEFLPTVMHE